MGWSVAALAAIGPLVVPGAPPVWRIGVAVIAATSSYLLMQMAIRRVRRDLARLEETVADLVDGPDERVVLPVAWPDLVPLAETIEQVYGRSRLQVRLLEQQREDLAFHLTRTEERLRDPNAEARRNRIARIGDLQTELTVGDSTSAAALLDLSLETGVMGVKPDHAERLVPGLPVSLTIMVDEVRFEIGHAVVLAPARGGLLDLSEWVFRFDPPLRPSVLPAALAKALELRGAERIRPLAANPANATIITELGRMPATVVDVSATGLGISTGLDARRAGRIGTSFTVQLHLPTMGEVAILPVTLRNMAVRSEGVRMGLSFDKDAEQVEIEKVQAWLEATRRALAA